MNEFCIYIAHFLCEYIQMRSTTLCGGRDLRLIVLIREDLKVEPFADVITRFRMSFLSVSRVDPSAERSGACIWCVGP